MKIVGVLSFIVVLFLANATVSAEDNFFEARINKVAAANKLILSGGTVVELAGIVMPGVRDNQAVLKALAVTAKKNIETMTQDKIVRFEFVEQYVSDGARQAYVFCSGIFINAYLVKNGFAVVADTLSVDDTYAAYLTQMQAQAVQGKKGVWAYATS